MSFPFPGMNPYLEQPDVWHDFHYSIVLAIRSTLTPLIRPAYLAKIDENVYVHELSAEERVLLGRPDVAVLARHDSGEKGAQIVINPAPTQGHLQPATDVLREPFIEIRDARSRELITAIEVLSPTNKGIGPDRDQYLAKRKRIIASAVHMVEIDLLRGGPRMPVDDLPQCDYAVMVSRSFQRPRVDLWPIRLRERLPEIPIPLRHGDVEASIDLQAHIEQVYEAAGYEDYVYSGTPQPLLHPEDAAWAAAQIAALSRENVT
jgi:hypothetical protein